MPILGPTNLTTTQTPNDIISSALRLIGVLGSGETATGTEASDGLMILNQMLDSFNAERMMIWAQTMKEFALPNQPTVTLGPGGTLDTTPDPRPSRVERYGIVILNNAAQPLELPLERLTVDTWAAIPVKLVPSTFPTKIYDDDAFPLRNLNFWPVPTAANDLRVYYWKDLTTGVSALTTPLQFPPGYAECLRYNLAVRLAPEYGVLSVPPVVAQLAMESKGRIKSMNAPIKDMFCDPAISRQDQYVYDWRTDGPVTHK